MKRLFDIVVSFVALLFLFIPGLAIAVVIVLGSRGGVFFTQTRVGLEGHPFKILKFRTMRPESEASGQLTVGERDPRITREGAFLRKSKLDELPQLLNILKGDMSFVGPRPEVPKYVELYNNEQRKVLDVRPGLTDQASLEYFEENKLLGASVDPERTYIEEIMPHKLALNLEYLENRSFLRDLGVMWRTVKRIVS